MDQLQLQPTLSTDGTDPAQGGGTGGGGSGLGQILGALALAYTAYQGSRNQDKQNRANREMADLSWEREKEMWNMMNEYNSPSSQMSRYAEAGLSANLMYGQGNSGNAGSMPHYQAPQQSYAFNPGETLMSAIPLFQGIQMRSAQVDNIRSQTENIRARTANESLKSALLEISGEKGRTDLETYSDNRQAESKVKRFEAGRAPLKLDELTRKIWLMEDKQKLNQLDMSYKRSNLTTQEIDQERKRADLLFQQYRNEWMKQGITSSDNLFFRILVRSLSAAGIDAVGAGATAATSALGSLNGQP